MQETTQQFAVVPRAARYQSKSLNAVFCVFPVQLSSILRPQPATCSSPRTFPHLSHIRLRHDCLNNTP